MCHAGTNSARPSVTPLPEPQWGLPLTEPPRPYSFDYNRRNRSNGRKLSIPSTSRTLAARRGEQSTNLLAGLDASFACAPSRQTRIASQLVKNGAHKTGDRESTRLVNKQLSDLWKIPIPEGHSISEPFRLEEFAAALRRLKPGKSPGLDFIFPEFILHAGSALKSWFCDFLNSRMRQLKILKIWRRALVVAFPNPEKPLGDTKSYRPISLLCVPFKILERLIYARVETIIDPLLPQEQAGFRHGRSAVDQVTLLTQDIEDSFTAKKKAGAVFVDFTAAYDTVRHRSLTCKLLRLLPDRHMVCMIMEMVGNRSFTLTTGNGQRSRLRRLKNVVPQGSVLAPYCSTSTSPTCQPPSPESMHMLTT